MKPSTHPAPTADLSDDGGGVAAVPTGGADVLNVSGVSFGYAAGAPVIDGLDLSVSAGEIVSVIGPSGCGKSSLLKLVARLEQPARGRVVTEFQDPSRHGCAMVFQDDTLLPWLRVRDNVLLHDRFRRQHRTKAATERADELLRMVGLEDKARKFPSELSGGMKRRVAVLAAVAATPELLLMDEPFSALDEPTRIGVHRDVYELVHRFQTSVVLVTHDLAEAISLSDRVVLLSKAPSRVVREYAMPFGKVRDVTTIRTDHRFLDIYGKLWEDLNAQITSGGDHS